MSAHTGSRAPRPLRGILALVVAGLVALGGPLAVSSPALAHDQLIAADPAAFAVLAEGPAAVTLTFSGELSTGQGATEVQVLDADGAVVDDGEAITEGTTVSQPVSPELANGDYRVLWKVVSGDGHPLSGEYAFTVQAVGPVPTATPSESATPTEEPGEAATSAPSGNETPAAVDAADASSTVPWVLLAIVGVAILAGIVYLLVSRARRQRESDAIRASQAAASSPGSDAAAPQSGRDTDR